MCGSGGSVRVFPYDEKDPTGPKRTHTESIEQAKQAASHGATVSQHACMYMVCITRIN